MSMPDPRIEAYARLLIERCVHVEPSWQVQVACTPLARPLVEEVARAIARRGAYAIVQMSYTSIGTAWAQEAPEALLGQLSDIQRYVVDHADAYVGIDAPENTRDRSDLSPERQNLLRQAMLPSQHRFLSLT